MESTNPLPILFLSLTIFVTLFFLIRYFIKGQKTASPNNSSSTNTDHSTRKEIQNFDSGAVISPIGEIRTSVHWEKYKNANALLDAEKMDEAIVIFKSLAAIPEEAEFAFIGLGTCYSLKNELPESIAYYQKAIQLNGNSFNAFLGLASSNYKSAHYPTAIVYYKKANVLNPQSPDPYWGLAAAYDMMKEKQLASDNAKIFIKMVPDSRYVKHLERMIIN